MNRSRTLGATLVAALLVILGGTGPRLTVEHTEIRRAADGINAVTGGRYRHNWIHTLRASGDPHYDGIQMDGGISNVVFDHNFVDMSEHGQTSTVMVDNYFGPITAIAVTGNKLLGGGYTVYADGGFSTSRAVEVTYANNVLGKGTWGYLMERGAQVTWTGNTDLSGNPVR